MWMSQFGVEELDWPAQSPDLNPIEHLWDELERRLRARPSRPTSVSDLRNALLEERIQQHPRRRGEEEDECKHDRRAAPPIRARPRQTLPPDWSLGAEPPAPQPLPLADSRWNRTNARRRETRRRGKTQRADSATPSNKGMSV
ncbi:hypothetical protein SRHO_G00223300 [Serrasalmus rhombeus]